LLFYSIFSSLNSKKIERTIVSTDNDDIAKYAKKLGSEVIKRPKKLASHSAQIEPTIKYTLDYLKKTEDYVPQVIVLLQNTSPLRNSPHIDKALKLFFDNNYDSVLSGYLSNRFFWEKIDNKVYPKNYDPTKRPNRQDMKTQFIENGAIYITKISEFNSSQCRVSGKIGLYQMPEELSIEIDSRFDLFLAEKIMELKNIEKKKI